MRLFIAVQFQDELKARVALLQDELKKSGADVKWVDRDNFHLTLKFLGEVAEDKTELLTETVAGIFRGTGSFILSLAGVGGFPSAEHPRVVWVGVREGCALLKDAAALLDEVLLPLGFPGEAREFSCHVTLGRVRSSRGLRDLAKKILDLRDREAGPSPVKRIDILQSFLGPSSPRYECLRSISI